MRRGFRSIFRKCECGCGQNVPPVIDARTGRVGGYRKWISGHGNRVRAEHMRNKLRADPMSHPRARYIGATRLHNAGHGLIYRMVKLNPTGRWKYEHRVIVEDVLGRKLRTEEHVHHKNGDTLDNSPENLIVMLEHEHHRHHSTTAQWAKRFRSCIECGTVERKHEGKGLCTACFQRQPSVKARRRQRRGF